MIYCVITWSDGYSRTEHRFRDCMELGRWLDRQRKYRHRRPDSIDFSQSAPPEHPPEGFEFLEYGNFYEAGDMLWAYGEQCWIPVQGLVGHEHHFGAGDAATELHGRKAARRIRVDRKEREKGRG